MGLSPVSVVNRFIGARPRITPSDARANRMMLGADQANLANASAGWGAWHADEAEVAPPRLTLPGPSDSDHCWPQLAA